MEIIFNEEDIRFWKDYVGYTDEDIKQLKEKLQDLLDDHIRENVLDAGM